MFVCMCIVVFSSNVSRFTWTDIWMDHEWMGGGREGEKERVKERGRQQDLDVSYVFN